MPQAYTRTAISNRKKARKTKSMTQKIRCQAIVNVRQFSVTLEPSAVNMSSGTMKSMMMKRK